MPAIRKSKRRPHALDSRPARALSRMTIKAYDLIGVDPATVAAAPKITTILLQSFSPKSESKAIDRAIMYLRGSSHPDAKKILKLWDVMPFTYQHLVPFESYCLAAGLTTERGLELIFSATLKQSDLASRMIVSAAQPEIVAASVKRSKGQDGAADAKNLLQHTGFLPMPKTQIINSRRDTLIDNSTHTDNSQSISIGELTVIDRQSARIANRFNERLGLASGLESSDTLSAEVMENTKVESDLSGSDVSSATEEWDV